MSVLAIKSAFDVGKSIVHSLCLFGSCRCITGDMLSENWYPVYAVNTGSINSDHCAGQHLSNWFKVRGLNNDAYNMQIIQKYAAYEKQGMWEGSGTSNFPLTQHGTVLDEPESNPNFGKNLDQNYFVKNGTAKISEASTLNSVITKNSSGASASTIKEANAFTNPNMLVLVGIVVFGGIMLLKGKH